MRELLPHSSYRTRMLDGVIPALLLEHPAVLLTGPRAVGKTTTVTRHARHIVRLDQPTQAAAFQADPDAALARLPEPVLLDEWQAVPELLGAVKRAVDATRRPGRFLLAGSVASEGDPRTWPGVGRILQIPIHPLTAAERFRGSAPSVLDRFTARETLSPPRAPPGVAPGHPSGPVRGRRRPPRRPDPLRSGGPPPGGPHLHTLDLSPRRRRSAPSPGIRSGGDPLPR